MIPLLSIDEAIKRGKEFGLDERFAGLNAFRVMLNNPRAAGAVANLLRTLMFTNTVNARARELVILRTDGARARNTSSASTCECRGISR